MKRSLITLSLMLAAAMPASIHAGTSTTNGSSGPAQEAAVQTAEPITVNPNELTAFPHLTSGTRFLPKDINEQAVSDVSDGIFSIMEYNREYGYSSYFSFYSVDGDYIFPPMWEMPSSGRPRFDNGAAVVKYPRKLNPQSQHAIIYADGSVRELPVTWNDVTQFYDGVAMVYEISTGKQQIFYINTKGEKILPHLTHIYNMRGPMGIKDRMRYLREERRAFFSYKDRKWGYLDNTGKIVITPKFQEVRDFHNGYALAIVKDETGKEKAVFIDKTGKTVLDIPTSAPTLYYAQDVSDIDNGIFSIRSNSDIKYYDLAGAELAKYPEGTPFHNGHAFVKTDGSHDAPISIIDTRFKVIREIGLENISLNVEKAAFNDLGIATFDQKYVFTDDGQLILRTGDSYGNKILDFSQDGYAKAVTKFTLNGSSDTYLGILNPKGELKIIFGKESYTAFQPVLPVDPPITPLPPEDPEPPIISDPEPPVIDTIPDGPKDFVKATYDIQVIASPQEGGTVSGAGTYHFGDTVRISAKANEGWFISGVEASSSGMNTGHPAKYVVRNDGTITVYFSREDSREPLSTSTYQGTVTMLDEAGNQMVQFPLYLETDADGNYQSPYGDKTYGVLAPMLDPELTLHNQLTRDGKVIEGSNVSYNCFYTPFKVTGITTDPVSGKKYLNVDGGQLSVRNMTILSTDATQMNSLNTLMANLMVQFDGMSDIEIPSYSYRIEMLDIDESTGAFTFGGMECFSPQSGWVSSDDPRLHKRLRTLFMYGYTKPLPADTFNGIRMEKAPKRTDILWYPPESFLKTESGIVETLGKQYREFASDYEVLRELNLRDLTEDIDENIFKRF